MEKLSINTPDKDEREIIAKLNEIVEWINQQENKFDPFLVCGPDKPKRPYDTGLANKLKRRDKKS